MRIRTRHKKDWECLGDSLTRSWIFSPYEKRILLVIGPRTYLLNCNIATMYCNIFYKILKLQYCCNISNTILKFQYWNNIAAIFRAGGEF